MAMELLPRYGESRAGCQRRQAGEKSSGDRLGLSRVSAAVVMLTFFALVIILVSWSSSAATGRVSVDDPKHVSRNSEGAERTVGRRILGVTVPMHEQKKREAMNKLEDVLLEPPRAASERSRTYQRRTRYLSDLMGEDILRGYPRRVFVDAGPPGSNGAGWFERTYPTKGLSFEKYEMRADEDEGRMTEWMRERVEEGEFVVMKAEAEAVEEMVKSRAIRLVDELFLECKTKHNPMKPMKKKKAYWECLALYGKLRDQGVAVHQWWG